MSQQDFYFAAGVCAHGHHACRAANGCLGSYGGAADTKCPDAGAQPSFSSAMSGTVFYSKLINEQLIKKAMWESEEKRREGRRGKGRKLHTADLIICKV